MATNNFAVIPGGQEQEEEDLREVEFTLEGLGQFIAKVLRDKGDLASGLTADDVLNNSRLATLRATCEQGFKKQLAEVNAERAEKRRKLEAARNEELVARAAQLDALLREEHGLPPVLTQEEINARLQAVSEDISETSNEPMVEQEDAAEEIPALVLELRQRFGHDLPEQVYEHSDYALMFRDVVSDYFRPFRNTLKKSDLEASYRESIAILHRNIHEVIQMANEVVRAWGVEIKGRANNSKLYHEIRDLVSTDSRFSWMTRCPSPEELKLRAEALAKAEAEEERKRVSRQQTLDAIVGKLMALETVDNHTATKLSHKIVKKYFDECKGDADKMLRAAAANKMVGAQSDEDRSTALLCAKAGGMSPEELEQAVAEKRRVEERIRIMREQVSFAAAGPAVYSKKSQKDKGNGGNKKGQKGQRKQSGKGGRQ